MGQTVFAVSHSIIRSEYHTTTPSEVRATVYAVSHNIVLPARAHCTYKDVVHGVLDVRLPAVACAHVAFLAAQGILVVAVAVGSVEVVVLLSVVHGRGDVKVDVGRVPGDQRDGAPLGVFHLGLV